MEPNYQLFDRILWRARRSNTATSFKEHDIIHQLAQDIAMQRLDFMDKSFERAVIIGAHNPELAQHPKLQHCFFMDSVTLRLPAVNHIICADDEYFPFQHNSLDAIISIMTMHNVNDLAGALVQMQRALKPDGLLLIVTSGAQTLYELRESFAHAEQHIYSGITPRIHPFMETRDAGALLQRTGFNLPVIDTEKFTLSYENPSALMKELRGSGEANCMFERMKQFEKKTFFDAVSAYYAAHFADAEQRIICTAELLSMTAWKPHESQQKPLARGSGKMHLGDVLHMCHAK